MVASSPAGACWPFLAWLAGRLIQAIGAGQLERVLPTVTAALGVFLVQNQAQFGLRAIDRSIPLASRRQLNWPTRRVSSPLSPAVTRHGLKNGEPTCRMGSCNAWPLPVLWTAILRCCFWMKPPAPLMRRRNLPCSGVSARRWLVARCW